MADERGGRGGRWWGLLFLGGILSNQDLFSSVEAFLEPLEAAVAVEVEDVVVAVSEESLLLLLSLVPLLFPPDLQ